jgi:hypothetical protein
MKKTGTKEPAAVTPKTAKTAKAGSEYEKSVATVHQRVIEIQSRSETGNAVYPNQTARLRREMGAISYAIIKEKSAAKKGLLRQKLQTVQRQLLALSRARSA